MIGEKFWMVLVDGTETCRHKHQTLEAARLEAERLIKTTPHYDKGVTILEAMEHGTIIYPPVEWIHYTSRTAEGVYRGGDEVQ